MSLDTFALLLADGESLETTRPGRDRPMKGQ